MGCLFTLWKSFYSVGHLLTLWEPFHSMGGLFALWVVFSLHRWSFHSVGDLFPLWEPFHSWVVFSLSGWSFHSVGGLFTLWVVSFDAQQFLILTTPVCLFFLLLLYFWCHTEEVTANPVPRSVPRFPLSFTALGLRFRPLIHRDRGLRHVASGMPCSLSLCSHDPQQGLPTPWPESCHSGLPPKPKLSAGAASPPRALRQGALAYGTRWAAGQHASKGTSPKAVSHQSRMGLMNKVASVQPQGPPGD